MKFKILLMIISFIYISGCTVLGSKEWYEGYGRPALLKKAAFDLDCPESKLRDQTLSGYFTIGVSGCGKKASYKYIDTLGWVTNTISK